MDGARTLETFLAGVERKAFRMAQIALRHEADALDVVQDAMLQLSSRYASRPPEEWRPLFYRILENRIRDVQRRRSVAAASWPSCRGAPRTRTTMRPIRSPRRSTVDPMPPAQLETER